MHRYVKSTDVADRILVRPCIRARLGAMAAERVDAWNTEGLVAAVRTVGMEAPDEVVVINYDSPQQAARLRKKNPDVLKLIGEFNKRHILEFTYIAVSVAPIQ